MRILKLMADYGCWPLWDGRPDHVGPVDPADLPITAELMHALKAWAARYDATLDCATPQQSGFANEAAAQRWIDDGQVLATQLRDELDAGQWTITYFQEHTVAANMVAEPFVEHHTGTRSTAKIAPGETGKLSILVWLRRQLERRTRGLRSWLSGGQLGPQENAAEALRDSVSGIDQLATVSLEHLANKRTPRVE
jgi:hypothetical protein